MNHEPGCIKKHFDSIDDYDTCAEYVVPWNSEIQETVYRTSLEYLGWHRRGRASALDIGIGTAHGASIFLKNNKFSSITGIDFSKHMLGKAMRNLTASGLMGRTKIVCADFSCWQPPRHSFDLCFSTLAVHNIPDLQKRALFRNIFSSLKKGGLFINGDFVQSEGRECQQAWKRYYEAYMRNHLKGSELSAWLHHAFNEDKPAKLPEQKKWLQEAGFSSFEVIWQKHNMAVYVAKK